MSPELEATLFRGLAPGLGIVLMAVIAQIRGLSWRDDLRWVKPAPRVLLLWLAIWAVWVALGELASALLHLPAPPTWRDRSLAEIAILAVGIVLLAPAAEELAFRGFGFNAVSRSPLGPAGAVVGMAVVFAVLHLQYGPAQLLLIFLDGVVLGLARLHSGSLAVPMLMHCGGNLFALWQRVHA